jgi:DNA primase
VGNAVTPYHTELLCRYAQRAILFLDNNPAGWSGTEKAGELLLKRGLTVEVANYPDERQQPDDLISDEIKAAIKTRQSFFHWRQQT